MDEHNGFEHKQTITFTEFKAWLAGLIRGMDGDLPGVEEWKMIKQMMDKVVEEQKSQPTEPTPPPTTPYPMPWTTPGRYPYEWPSDQWPYRIWCSTNDTTMQVYNTADGPGSSMTHDFGERPVTYSVNADTTNSLDTVIETMINKNSEES